MDIRPAKFDGSKYLCDYETTGSNKLNWQK